MREREGRKEGGRENEASRVRGREEGREGGREGGREEKKDMYALGEVDKEVEVSELGQKLLLACLQPPAYWFMLLAGLVE